MRREKIVKGIDVIIKGLAVLIICFIISFFLGIAFSLIIASMMGYEVSEEPTLAFWSIVLLILIVVLFLVKRFLWIYGCEASDITY